MNKVIFLALALLTTTAFAAPPESPLFRKTHSSGFMPPAYIEGYECFVFRDHVIVRKSAGTLESTVITNVKLNGDIDKTIAEAAIGTISSHPAPTDGPVTGYEAFNIANGQTIPLKYEGSIVKQNSSPVAVTLINFINQLCK